MAKSTRTKRAAKSTKTKSTKVVTPGQEAAQITWKLKGDLKNAQISYLRVGKMLALVKDRKLFSALGHPTLEEYADQRLALGQASLYRYIQVYEWASAHHPEWLQPKPKGFIPDLTDATSLIRIEQDLATTTLSPAMQTTLEALRVKGLEGTLTQAEVQQAYRKPRSPRPQDSLSDFVSKLRSLRKRGARLTQMPAEAIGHIDAAIDILTHNQVLAHIALPTPRRLVQYMS